jgi:tripartite-type tricarboxylate transporter receptor subunit TctC
MKNILGFAAVFIALFAQALPAAAQSWPTRPVKLVLPLGPGSGTDIGARLFADRLSARWGQPVVVENRPGGDGVIAINAVLSAKDDHTLFWGPTSSIVGHPYVLDKMPYDPKDLVPVARVTSTVVVIAAPTALNVTSL